MKKHLLSIILLCCAVLSGCNSGLSGETTKEELGIKPDYEIVKVKGYARITINLESRVVVTETDKNLQKYIKVKQKGKTLVIDASNDRIKNAMDETGDRLVCVEIPYSTAFDDLRMEGSSTFDFEMMLSPDIKITTSGSNIITGPVTCESMKIKSSGSDQILIDVNCDRINLDMTGTCTAGNLMIPLTCSEAECHLAGTCTAYVEAGTIKGMVEDDSELHYVGDQECRAKTTGTARIINDPDREPHDINLIPRKL